MAEFSTSLAAPVKGRRRQSPLCIQGRGSPAMWKIVERLVPGLLAWVLIWPSAALADAY
jgi:hypothetical protein